MNTLRMDRLRGRWALPAAALLVALTVSPREARAQAAPRRVCVLSFNCQSRTAPAQSGQLAASRVAAELGASSGLAVVPEAEIAQRAQQLNVRAPFDRAARARLAGALGAAVMVYGTVTEARCTTGAAPRGYVRLIAMAEDVESGGLLAAATAEGASMGAPGTAADSLLGVAFQDAARRVRSLLERTDLGPDAGVDVLALGDASVVVPAADTRVAGSRTETRKNGTAGRSGRKGDKSMTAAEDMFAVQPPPPVVVEVPGEGERRGRRQLITTRALRLLAGGLMFFGLTTLAGTGW